MNRQLISEPHIVHSTLSDWGGTLVFLALDPFMAWPMLGLCKTEQAIVICWDDGPGADVFRDHGIEVLALGQDLAGSRSTDKLLQAPAARARLIRAARNGPVGILAFKPSARLQSQIHNFGFDAERVKLLASPSNISRAFENKLRFAEKIRGFDAPFPKHELVVPSELESVEELFERISRPFVAQFGAGYSGAGTALIHDAKEWEQLIAPRPSRKLRITRKVEGRTLTINACVTKSGAVAVGQAMEQLTGWSELTPHELGSCGNVWNPKWLSQEIKERLFQVTREVGRALAEAGFLGHFGVDAIVDATDYVYVIETNPRLTANVPVDTLVSRLSGEISLFARHILSHLNLSQTVSSDTANGPTVSQWIVRHSGEVIKSPNQPWSLIQPSQASVAVAASADLGLCSKPGAGLFMRSAPGRDLSSGSEIGRLIMAQDVAEADRKHWMQAVHSEAQVRKPNFGLTN